MLALRVLIAQADVGLAPILARGMEADGMLVEHVGTAQAAIARASDGGFSVIVLDAILPDLDGFRVCQEMRARGIETPILFLTARDSVSDRVRGLELGADDYVTKPFAVRELTARLRALARRAMAAAPLTLSCGDLRLDRVGHHAYRGSTRIALSQREFAVLEALMLSPGLVLSRENLLERAWGSSVYGPSNVVDVYIGYLRRKIDRPFGRGSLQTIRGAGYRLVANA